MSEKLNQKQLKNPDELQVTLLKIMDYILGHKVKIFVVAAVIACIWLGGIGFSYWKSNKTASLIHELSLVDDQFDKELEVIEKQQTEISKSISDIDKKLSAKVEAAKIQPKKGEKEAATVPPAPVLSESERAQLMVEKLTLESKRDALKPDHTGSLKGYRDFFEKHRDTKEGWAAGMKAASILAQQKKLPEAVTLMKTLVTEAKGNEYYQMQGRLNLIGLLEDSGDFKAAMTYAEDALKSADTDLTPQILLIKARLQYLNKDKEAAKKVIDQLLKDHAASAEARQAKSFKALLY